MLRTLLSVILLAATASAQGSTPAWHAHLLDALPLLGHRNWILVVDSAYPLQTSPGIETIDTGETQLEVVRSVLHAIEHSSHIRPVVFMDSELPYITDDDAPGVSVYRGYLTELFRDYPVEQLPHEKIISTIDEAGRTFHILVLKTNMTIPYTSVFFRLDCKYWTADQESALRKKMAEKSSK